MKLFDDGSSWNWVDENNVVLGFRNFSNCCERFGYRYDNNEPSDNLSLRDTEAVVDSLDDYIFDTSYCNLLHNDSCDAGGYAAFRLVHKNTNEYLYLTIYNHHNGWYSHGFTFSQGDRTIRNGSL